VLPLVRVDSVIIDACVDSVNPFGSNGGVNAARTAGGDRDAGGSTRDRLIDASLVLLREGGEDALSMRALGELSGLSRGAPYRHFEDKEALLRAIAAAGMEDLGRRAELAVRRTRGSQLAAALRAYVTWGIENPDWYRVTFQSRATGHREAPDDFALTGAGKVLLESFVRLVVAAQETGELPPGSPTELFGVLWSAVHGTVDLSLAGRGKAELGTADPRRLVDTLLALLAGH
jgi:AcrR family transcriptional regulator